jgi:hypothetical protein
MTCGAVLRQPVPYLLSKIRNRRTEKRPIEVAKVICLMAEAEPLTRDQFVSLLMVGDARSNGYAPYIPIADETLLIRLGYVEKVQGHLTMTAPGRVRIASVETFPNR